MTSDTARSDADRALHAGLATSAAAIGLNVVLAAGKIVAGVVGHSYALVADGIESSADIVSSFIVWSGLRISLKPPDRSHPYGHGKAESIAGGVVALSLLGAAAIIAAQSVREILTPHHAPEWYTLVVLCVVIAVKEFMFRRVLRVGSALNSRSLTADAWHHRSDAITSAAAFVGISIALAGGAGYESADDWAALVACAVIAYNGARLLRPAVDEVMDRAASDEVVAEVRQLASSVAGVRGIEKCRVRKSGLGLLMDIHVLVDGDASVRDGHAIGHDVKDRLAASRLGIVDVVVHIEPAETGEREA